MRCFAWEQPTFANRPDYGPLPVVTHHWISSTSPTSLAQPTPPGRTTPVLRDEYGLHCRERVPILHIGTARNRRPRRDRSAAARRRDGTRPYRARHPGPIGGLSEREPTRSGDALHHYLESDRHTRRSWLQRA
jgi:hypothetical protein